MSHHNNNHNNEGAKPVNVFADNPEREQAQTAEERNNPHNIRPEHIAGHPAAARKKERVILTADIEDEKDEHVIELSSIYSFEGEDIESIDLTGIEDLSQKDEDKAMKVYQKIASRTSVTPEFTTEFAIAVTHVLTGLPLEMVKQLKFKDRIRLKNAVMSFLYNAS